MEICSLLFPIMEGRVLLAKVKIKRSPCFDHYNGYGGKMKPEDGGDVRNTACREYREEAGARARPEELELVAVIDFFEGGEYRFECHVFFGRNCFYPRETADMGKPGEFFLEDVPYDEMMPADVVWLKPVFEGARFHGECYYAAGNQELLTFKCKPLVP